MHKAKYLLVSLVAAGLLLFPTLASAKKLNVVTSTTDMAALAQEVGGDRISVESIARAIRIRTLSRRSQASCSNFGRRIC